MHVRSGPGCIESTNTNNYYYYYSTPLPIQPPPPCVQRKKSTLKRKQVRFIVVSYVSPLYDIYICDDDRRLSAIILSIARRFSRVEVCRSVVEECKLMK